MELLEKQIEGLIYISADDGVSLKQIISITEATDDAVLEGLDNIKKRHEDSNSALELVDYGEKYHFITKPECFETISKFLNLNKVKQLSQSQLETLAIIAYKQPVTRIEIEEIRGIGSEITLRKLLAAELISEAGRLDTPGRPILYQVADNFFDTFQMVSLNELPKLQEQEELGELFQ
ncbi:MAG TPA: SMC-Scp complex subunit ScpB [Erysipelothrix sp.]|jgi:segregation and condensation protein B|nr:SMC-Scp complex subunit ScpB [Erysipelothrix sp.]